MVIYIAVNIDILALETGPVTIHFNVILTKFLRLSQSLDCDGNCRVFLRKVFVTKQPVHVTVAATKNVVHVPSVLVTKQINLIAAVEQIVLVCPIPPPNLIVLILPSPSSLSPFLLPQTTEPSSSAKIKRRNKMNYYTLINNIK